MATHKVTMEFESTVGQAATSGSNFGWTESIYRLANETPANTNGYATRLATARRLLLTPGWSLTGIRIIALDASFNTTRKGEFISFTGPDARGTYPGLNVDEQAYDCLNVRMTTADGNGRTYQFRGIGNDVINAGGRFLNPAAFNTAFIGYRKQLLDHNESSWGGEVAQQWALKVRMKTADLKLLNVIIDPAVFPGANPTNPVFVTDGNIGINNGGTMVVSGVKGMTNVNGVWIVKELKSVAAEPPTHVVVRARRRATLGGVYQASGKAVFYSYTLSEINNATAERGGTRRTGRPSQQPRGRRSNRPS